MPAVSLQIELPAHFLDDPGRRAGFVLLMSFLVSYLLVRTNTRLIRSPRVPWWPGNITTSGGLHIHHLVWGILLLLLSGFLGFALDPGSPRTEILAAAFGVGAALTLDEFALWVHLQDVYWSEEGRSSFEAVVAAALIGGLIVLGAAPFDLRNQGSSIDTLVLAIVTDVLLASVAILKGKPLTGLIGILVPLVSLVGAVRLASPTSPWAHRFYKPNGRKFARSQTRWAGIEARRRRLSDTVAGAPGVAVAIEPAPGNDETP
jgi:hypothetical protein